MKLSPLMQQLTPDSQSDVAKSTSGVLISGTSTHRLNDENLKAVPSTAGNASAWNNYARSGEVPGQEFTAYDPQGRAHTKIHSPSVADTEESFATTPISRVTDREMVHPISCAPPK